MIDMKSLLKLEPFSGKREEFGTFKWELYVALDILDPMLRTMMELVEKNPQREFLLKSFTEFEKQKAKDAYAILALTCKGTAAQYVRAAERSNGFDAWRSLCRKNQVRAQVALLNRLLHPQFESQDARMNLAQWQQEVQDYEQMTGDMVTDGTKRAST